MFNLRRFRKDFKLTQTEIAFILGCGQPNIAAIEKDGRGLLDEQVKALEEKYGDLSYYMTDESNSNQSNNDSNTNWVELTNKQQTTIDRLLDLLEKEKQENIKLSQILTELTKKVIEKIAV